MFAKSYKSYMVGYNYFNSKLKTNYISQDNITTYAYRVYFFDMEQNYFKEYGVFYQPKQRYINGYNSGRAYYSSLQKSELFLQAGFKKYIIPFFYFMPLLKISYVDTHSHFSLEDANVVHDKKDKRFILPLDVVFGYSIARKSDIFLGLGVDRDLFDSSDNDYNKIFIRYLTSFKNIKFDIGYSYIIDSQIEDFKQESSTISFAVGLHF